MKFNPHRTIRPTPLGAKLRPTLAAIGLGLAMILATGSAQALTFGFTFTGDTADDYNGNPLTGATVSGTIQGLTDNLANQASSLVTITSYSSVDPFMPALPIVISNISANSFTVSGGQITAADFAGQDSQNIALLYLNQGASNNWLVDQTTEFYIINSGGFTGATYTPIAAVPELPVPLMLSLGMLVPLLTRRARKLRLSV
jgi:hypothetical protein